MMTKYLSLLILIVFSINSYSDTQPVNNNNTNNLTAENIHQKKSTEVIVFNTFIIPLAVESENEGVFIELTKDLAKRAGLEIKINILPTKRALNDFNASHAEVLFPALDPFFNSDNNYYKTQEFIYKKRDLAFNLIGNESITSITQLEGKRVSITRGYGYANELLSNPKIHFFTTSSDEYSAKMLQAGHVDAFIAEQKTGLAALSRMNMLASIQYSEQNPISELDVFYATQNTTEGRALAEKLSKHLAAMKKDGSFARIMTKLHQAL